MDGVAPSVPSPPIVVILGPTAVGKSALALELAPRLGAEIVNADSRQVYRHLDIGTAKPGIEERARVVHHLVDFVEPDDPYSAARYQDDADKVLEDLASRRKVALLVGGTPLYIQAVVDRLAIPRVPPNPALRLGLEQEAARHGPGTLHQRLAEVDPEAAQRIPPSNVRRVVRALEVVLATGRPFSELGRRKGAPRNVLIIGLTMDRAELYRRIDSRVDAMLRAGWLEEVRVLLATGFSTRLPAMTGSGYPELVAYLEGRMTREEAVERVKFSTHAYARRQYVWFRADPRIRWVHAGASALARAEALALDYLARPAG